MIQVPVLYMYDTELHKKVFLHPSPHPEKTIDQLWIQQPPTEEELNDPFNPKAWLPT